MPKKIFLGFFLLVCLDIFCQLQKYFSQTQFPFDSLNESIYLIEQHNELNTVVSKVFSNQNDIIIIGENHAWIENFPFYESAIKKIISVNPGRKINWFFETTNSLQWLIEDYTADLDSSKFRKQMFDCANELIPKYNLKKITELVICLIRNHQTNIHFIDQSSNNSVILKSAYYLLKGEANNKPSLEKQKRLKKQFTCDNANLNITKRINSGYKTLIYDTLSLFKHLRIETIGTYRKLITLYRLNYKLDDSSTFVLPSFHYSKSRELFMFNSIEGTSNHFNNVNIILSGNFHANRNYFVYEYINKNLSGLIDSLYQHKTKMLVCFDIINKKTISFTDNPRLKELSVKAYPSNLFWQKLVFIENEFGVFNLESKNKKIKNSFDYIILKKYGTDGNDDEEILEKRLQYGGIYLKANK